ncbi:inorganic phosphate cotransporter [Trichonephila clavipes]|nr:inorganic phosphate cotransporter [Trichonephila clavipes]
MMPSFSVLMGKWVPPTERARFMSVIASGIPVGGFFTVVISGILCHSPTFGWECYSLYLVYSLDDTDLRLAFEPSIHHKARTESDHVLADPKSSYYRKHKKLLYRLGCNKKGWTQIYSNTRTIHDGPRNFEPQSKVAGTTP